MREESPPARSRRRLPDIPPKRLRWIGAGIIAGALILLSLRPTPLEVETGEASRGPLETTVDAEGVTRVRDRFLIAAPTTGRLERVTLREGDAVEPGSIIARITPMPLDPQATAQVQARIGSAQAGLREAEARVAQAREALEQAERSTARIRTVAEAGAVSAEAVDRAELELASARRNHDAAVSRAQAMAAEVAAARAGLLGATQGGDAVAVVRSPTAGRVLRVHEASERVVAAGTPLVQIGDAVGLEVVVDVLSTEAVRIQPGALMRIVEWGGEDSLEARVRLVEPAGFTKVSTLGVEEQRVNVIGDLLNAPASLGDGYRVEARIVTWSSPEVLRVRNSALFRTGDAWSIFVIDDGRAQLRQVQVGRRGAHETEIIAGLDEGQEVILFPSDRVTEGARVRSRQ